MGDGEMVNQVRDAGIGFRYTAEQAARFKKEGWWRDEILLDHLDRWTREAPDRELVTDGIGRLTYGQARSQAYRLAAELRRMGVAPGDRVLVQLPNWNEFVVIYLAAIRSGAVMVPIMPIYRHDEVGYILLRSEAKVAFTAGQFRNFDHLQMFRDLRPHSPVLKRLVVVRGAAGPGELDLGDLTQTARGDDDFDESEIGPRPGADDGHVLIFTSGTESRPKGCLHTWNTIGFSVRGLSEAFQLDRSSVTFAPSPVSHGTGLAMGVAAPILTGGSIHLQDVWQPKEGLARIREHRCTHAATATPFVRMALDAFDPAQDEVSSMRAWVCAGAPIPASLAEEVAGAFRGCRLLPLYGASEIFATTACWLSDSPQMAVTSDGRPALAGVEVKVMNEAGQLAPSGEEGEVCYRGPGGMLGYWRDPERTAIAIDRDGWYHTGDRGQFNTEGLLRLKGRIKDVIIRGGTNISATEVEEHLLTHPKVKAVAVVAMPDRLMGEKACAFVVPAEADAPTLAELADYLKNSRRIAVHKIPERLEIVKELPMTPTGKVQKFALRDQARSLVEATAKS
jgi:non-ribosomal peptide synthetase component E (peptide arylation enzyme)